MEAIEFAEIETATTRTDNSNGHRSKPSMPPPARDAEAHHHRHGGEQDLLAGTGDEDPFAEPADRPPQHRVSIEGGATAAKLTAAAEKGEEEQGEPH